MDPFPEKWRATRWVCSELLWNVLLWNDLLWNDLLWNDLLWNDLLWNDSFRPFSEPHFIVSKSSYIPFIYSLYLHIPLYYPTMPRIHCIKYRYQGFLSVEELIRGVAGVASPSEGVAFLPSGGCISVRGGCIRGCIFTHRGLHRHS